MKKYLMMALAVAALATSCTKNDFESMSQAEIDQAKYDQAFLRYIGGTIAPNQDWGFSVTRGENANANEWADPDKAYGGLNVPPPLTDEQIAVVKKYFQTHPNLGYQDPKWTNYFMQQVYKGHTDVPEGCATPEAYMAANGTTYLIASDYMDHLAAIDPNKEDPETGLKPFVDHINNFNHGDCGENDHVLDAGGNANVGPFHTDKIMYMQNSTTKSFGYFNSNGSLCHTEYTALVSYKTIMEAMGAEANCLNDGWNRSFMGFDFEQMIDDQCYATKWENNQEVAKYFVINEYYAEYYINGEKSANYTYTYNGQPVRMLSDQMNRYCADVLNVDDSQLYSDYRVNGEYLGKQVNTDFIDDLLSQGYLPVDNKSLRVWAKVGGCADGYYSDWIVTLTEAKGTVPAEDHIVIIAEDLSATEASDFDFNDVVLRVEFSKTAAADDYAKITLLAAGGTLPLRIAENDEWEVHKLFGVWVEQGKQKMVNTGYAPDAGATCDPVDLTNILQMNISNAAEANDKLTLEVFKNGTWQEMKAPKGEPACKLAVDDDFEVLAERESIKGRYPKFVEWATANNFVSAWWKLFE